MFKVILFFYCLFLIQVSVQSSDSSPAMQMRKMSSEMNGGERSNASGGQKEGK